MTNKRSQLSSHVDRLPHDAKVKVSSNISLNKLDKEMNTYEHALELLAKDPNMKKEVNFGKRVGLYKLGKELGAGNFSKVKVGLHVLTKEKVAVKVMERGKMDQKTVRLLNREVKNMEELHHPNVIRLFEVVETLSKMFLVLEYAGGGELYGYVLERQRLTEREGAIIFAQVTAAVIHLHEKAIIHRDIKAENVFFAGPNWVKLGDFGFSVAIEPGSLMHTFCGSPPYAAPELFRDTQYAGEYVDLWALGVLLYFVLTGFMPFRGDTVADLKARILDGFYTIPEHVTPFAEDLIRGLLRMVPNERYNLGEILFNFDNVPRCTQRIQDHYFMNRCRFPEADEYISPYPNPEEDLKTVPIAGAVYDRLSSLGINHNMLKEAANKGAKNSIIGVYRIVVFMVQNEIAEKAGTRNPIPDEDEEERDDDQIARLRKQRKKASKMCTIL